MNYKNELLIEMNDLILNHSNSNLNNPSTPSQASTKSFTQVSTHVFHQISTLKSTQASSSNTNHSLNIITPPSTRSKKKCIGLNCRRVSNHAIINKTYCLKYFSFLEINNNWFSKSCKGFVNNNVINQCNDCIQVKKNITNIRHSELFKEMNTSITSIQNNDTFIQQIKEMWSNKASNMIINDFLSSNKIKTNIKLLSQYSNTLSPIELSDEVSMNFCKQRNQIGIMCQGVYIEKNSRINNMNKCINCENDLGIN